MADQAQRAAGRQAREGLVTELNRILDALAVIRPEADLLESGREALSQLADKLEALPDLPEDPDIPSHSEDNPRLRPDERGLVPALDIHGEDAQGIVGRVIFSPRFAGTSAVHGGAIGLFFDDFLGRLANFGPTGPLARTAYLHIDYRRLTPVSTELRCDAWVERVEGRKRTVRGSLRLGEKVVAEAEGLWIESRPKRKESA